MGALDAFWFWWSVNGNIKYLKLKFLNLKRKMERKYCKCGCRTKEERKMIRVIYQGDCECEDCSVRALMKGRAWIDFEGKIHLDKVSG